MKKVHKHKILFMILMVLIVSFVSAESEWKSKIGIKNFETYDFEDSFVSLYDSNILSESNALTGKTSVIESEEAGDSYEGNLDYSGRIKLENGGNIKYKLSNFRVDFSQVREDDTIYSGSADIDYIITIKVKVPIYAEVNVDNNNENAMIELSGIDNKFYYRGILDGKFKLENECDGDC